MSKSAEEYEAEILSLQEELKRLKVELKRVPGGMPFAGVVGNLTRGVTVAGGAAHMGKTGTVMGLEEAILQANPDMTIGYVNVTMARLLGIEERRTVIGEPIAKWDRGALGDGALQSVLEAAKSSTAPLVCEWTIPGLPLERLPPQHGPRPSRDPVLRLVATAVKGRVEMIVQDVTRLRWLEDTFARYVAPEVIEQMLQRPEENFMEMERRQITVLFADIRGFTRLTQELDPRNLQKLVNEFLTAMVDCVARCGGTVDKFVGDEVMAIFGAPVRTEEHPVRGLMAAVEMLRLHEQLMKKWAEAGYPAAGVGIGVTTGEVFVGNIGTPQRMEYTALGHWVNLAARLCGSAAGGEILTVPETYQATAAALKTTSLQGIPSFKFSPKGKLTFKNVKDPVTVLSVSVAGAL